VGLEVATGRYVAFVDADDEVAHHVRNADDHGVGDDLDVKTAQR
jgi:hypothetical protein